jgi:adenylate cyclase
LSQQWTKDGGLPMLVGLATVLAVLLLQFAHLPVVDRIGLLLFDTYQRSAPRPYQDAPVRIVDIDDETIRQLGQWPWPRSEVARLTDRLTEAGASAIAFDIVFSEPDRTSPARIAERMRRDGVGGPALAALAKLPDNDAILADSFARAPVVAGYFLTHDKSGAAVVPKAGLAVAGSPPSKVVAQYSGAIQPLPALQAAARGGGFLSIAGDEDGIVRKAPLFAIEKGQLLPSLSLDALRVAQQAGAILVKTSDASGEGNGVAGDIVSLKVGQFEAPLTRDGALWMHYTRPHPDRIVPAWKILTGALSRSEMEQKFSGQIVFVGTGAIGLRDLISTPLRDRELGVMVHAQAAEQIILGRFLTRPDWALGLERVLLLVLGGAMALLLPRLGAARGAVFGALLLAGTIGGSWFAFCDWHFLLDPSYPALGLVAVYLVETSLIFYREERRRAYIHSAFDRYLSPELVKRIAEDPGRLELGGEDREMTVLFCDIRNFTALSEKLDPKQVIRFLIGFLTPMCDILLAHKATIDKFIGDAVVAFWNAPLDDPDQHRNAARAALAMVERLKEMNRDMPMQQPDAWPTNVRIGIGLNAGLCCVGNMGSAQRLTYSLIGDTVNLASRIETLTKFYGVTIALGGALHDQIKDFATLEIDQVRVVGRDRPETIYTLLGDEALAKTPAFLAFAQAHAALLDAYRNRQWASARQTLARLERSAAAYGLERLYALYGERIAQFEQHPPDVGWDGVFTAMEKTG